MEAESMKQQDKMQGKQHERDMEKAKVEEKHSKTEHERHIERTSVDMAKKEHAAQVEKENPKEEKKK